MNILRHLYLNSVFRTPDDPAAPPVNPVVGDPPADPLAADPPVAGDTPADPPVAGDPPADPLAPAPKAPMMVPLPVMQRRIGEETTKRQASEQRATQAEQRAAELQATIDRITAERAAGGDPPPAARAPAAAPVRTQTEFDGAVRAEAQRIRLYDDTIAIRSAGEGKFSDFGDTLSVLTAIGATNDDFISDIIAVDKDTAHEILDKLAKDPEKAASMVAMDPRRRIAELTRMSDTIRAAGAPKPAAGDPPAPKPAPLSRAPAPKPALAPQASAPDIDPTTPDGNEKMSDAQFEKWYKDKYMRRA